MTPDLPPNPPDNAPVTTIVSPAPKAEPIAVDSHGYHYTIAGNVLLAAGGHRGDRGSAPKTPRRPSIRCGSPTSERATL